MENQLDFRGDYSCEPHGVCHQRCKPNVQATECGVVTLRPRFCKQRHGKRATRATSAFEGNGVGCHALIELPSILEHQKTNVRPHLILREWPPPIREKSRRRK